MGVCKEEKRKGNCRTLQARLVAKGYEQRRGIDYDEIFSPVAKYTSLRFLLALSSNEELQLLQLDVKSAFLNGTLEEIIFIEQSEGYLVNEKGKHVYRLHKALYGLKQASPAWNNTIDTYWRSIGFKQSNSDSSLYFSVCDGTPVFILVYVDDILLACKHMNILQKIAEKLGSTFDIRIENSVKKFLGIIVERDQISKYIKIRNAPMVDQLLVRFNMSRSRRVSTPLP